MLRRLPGPMVSREYVFSMTWKIPALRRRATRSACEATLDFCSYGARWRNRTHFSVGDVPANAIQHLICRLCRGRGVCSHSGLARVVDRAPSDQTCSVDQNS
eukprot:2010665-Pyramimonas_sp.AAC.1